MKQLIVMICVLTGTMQLIAAQEDSASTAMYGELPEIIFSAHRSERSIYEAGTAVQIISEQEISKSGTERLSDILARQAGIQLVQNHGTGVQLMGLSSEYVMILINGQPVAGRTAGVLDLDRISVSNVSRIEIVRGPASSLYGSEALAGVINIITSENRAEKGMIDLQYRRFNTTNISGRYNRTSKSIRWSSFANYYASSGYDLTPENTGYTAPPFTSGTLEQKLSIALKHNRKILIDQRSYLERQAAQYELSDGQRITGRNLVSDISTTLQFKSPLAKRTQMQASLYHSWYTNATQHHFATDKSLYYSDAFTLHFIRPEWTAETQWTQKHTSGYGAGSTASLVQSDRYDGRQQMFNYFAFLQHEWKMHSKVQLTGGLRFDGQSEFGHQINPKLTIVYQPISSWHWRIGMGTGFKAPDPRQLFLNFSNPLAGYAVFGAAVLEDALNDLQQKGQLGEVLAPINKEGLQAESSYAFNLGQTWKPMSKLSISTDAYYNHVFNLIDTRVVARKTNGQTIFSYFNTHRIFTTGLLTNVSYRNKGWVAGASYEFMASGDYSVRAALRAGEVFRRNPETLQTERVPTKDYKGLFNRPAHHGTLVLMYTHPLKGWFVQSRAVFHGTAGFADLNGNQIPDIADEMIPDYTLLYLSGGISLLDRRLELSSGIDNLSNFTAAAFLPGISGISPWIKARYIFH